jgi:hypothetical protein
LNSSLFNNVAWHTLQQQNVAKQLEPVQQTPFYEGFLFSALHINTKQPRLTTHVIMVQVKMGLGLGQFDRLERFSVLTCAAAKEEVQKHLAPDMLQQYERCMNESGSTIHKNNNNTTGTSRNSKWVLLNIFFSVIPTAM